MATTTSILKSLDPNLDSAALVDAVGRLPADARVGGPGLKPKQQTALTALASGCTITEAAELAGVHRNTASRWFNHDPVFRNALDALCDEMREESHLRLRNTSAEACRVVEAAVFGGNVAVSLQVLRAMGTFEAATLPRTENRTPLLPAPDNHEPPSGGATAVALDNHSTTDKPQTNKIQEGKFRPRNRIARIPAAAFRAMATAVLAWLVRVAPPMEPERRGGGAKRPPRRRWVAFDWTAQAVARCCFGLRAACTRLHHLAVCRSAFRRLGVDACPRWMHAHE